ncbi:ATP-binding protein [Glutamicibacter sp.]|uniref:ATP-binding protein n=1 Tax=Glutamicibacter sp. TaxID=1931995 RepID=UPI0028BF4215|nr:ATP-binding protein [Glutamicibacter sp.]
MGARGRLRVLLGAAPGVGKTYAMLEEGQRLIEDGHDVQIGFVETHGRAGTAGRVGQIPVIPRQLVNYQGVDLAEMDIDAVLSVHPRIALVDELAHTNVPGSRNDKRWQDVDELLEAGIDVITTVNIQHIESLNDVVEKITGVPQRETLPDSFLRRADQIEVIDLAPQALRDRLAGGVVYPAERIDAALSNYFRLGNLTALRELALLWLADEVDQALQAYRSEHRIEATWEARERVVVALPGGPEGETLLRRGARVAARSAGGELFAVHVTGQDGLEPLNPAALAQQRALVQKLGGTFHQIVGDDVPQALVEFAKSLNATQLIIGVSRRGRIAAALSGPGIGATVIRESGDLDVHIVTHAAAGGRFTLPPLGGALSLKRQVVGFVFALLAGPLLTWFLSVFRSAESITSDVLSYQLLVVLVALVGGFWPAIFAAVLSGLTLDYFFVSPLYTITIAEPLHALALVLYVLVAIVVSVVVDLSARRSRQARRSSAESELIQMVANTVLEREDPVSALVEQTREVFGLARVQVLADDTVLASSGQTEAQAEPAVIPLTDDTTLQIEGRDLSGSERRLLSVIVSQLESALERERLRQAAEQIEPLAASDKIRGALLSALSHDLRRPLAAATAAVGGLKEVGDELSADDRAELIDAARLSLASLSELVNDLLDVTRLQAGVISLITVPTDPASVIAGALDELNPGPALVRVNLGHEENDIDCDSALLQRVVVNLLTNALRHQPEGSPTLITTSVFLETLEIRVVDNGPGIPAERLEDVFVPFQRLGDTDNSTGLGLGLALARGFVEAMHGKLVPEETPGGGLTMVISLPRVQRKGPGAEELQEDS